jgi:hypothetical protein
LYLNRGNPSTLKASYLALEFLLALLIGCALALKHYALEFFKYREVLIGVVNFGIALLLADQKADFFQSLQLPLDVAGVFFYKFSKSPNMGFKVGVFSIYHDNLAPHTRSYERI